MLEIPESYNLAGQFNETVKGKTIIKAAANTSPHGFAFYYGDPMAYDALLTGKQIDTVCSYGGMVEILAGDTAILFNDGVNARYYGEGKGLPEKHQLLLTFDDRSTIICTVQMYGGLWAYKAGENDNPYYRVAKEKPSPLSDDFSWNYFCSLANAVKPNLSLKAFLATEQRIPGLGNGVLQDILFNTHLNPRTKLGALTDIEMRRVYDSVKTTLADMAEKGGRDTEKDLFGKAGGYKTILSNKAYKSGCRACGGSITKEAYLGGNVYYCPVCQPKK